jgi:fructose-bisphosphate aldolase class II
MPLMPFKNELLKARAAKYAVPMFDVFDMAGIDGVFAAIEDKRGPTMIAIYQHFVDQPNGKAFAAYIRARAESTPVPVALILDHGSSFAQCMKALSYGFTDVMFDGSSLPLEENIAITRQVVQAAHAFGASAEAELGHVGMGDKYDVYGAQRVGFTNPEYVSRFVAETGVDALAVAFGNAHGFYKGEPHLDLDLLAEIALVMHGGTGLSDDQFRRAIQLGVAKINVATIMINLAGKKMAEASQAEGASLFTINEAGRQAYRECCDHVYDVFGASGKA